jgi:hypothetical protein
VNHAYLKGGERLEVFHLSFDDSTRLISAKYETSTLFNTTLYNGILNDVIFVNEKDFFISKYQHIPDATEVSIYNLS